MESYIPDQARFELPLLQRPNDSLISLFGLELENETLKRTAVMLGRCDGNSAKKSVAFINADCVNQLSSSNSYRAALDGFDHLYADGVGMRIAARLQAENFVDNVNGTDLFPLLARELALNQKRIFLLGGRPGVAEKVARYISVNFPDLSVVGYHHGFLTEESTGLVLDKINRSRSDVVLVAMGAPKQEIWIDEHKSRVTTKLLIGVGGLFDFYSGNVSRAPVWLRRLSLEWVWRLMVQPRDKAMRYLVGNPLFLFRAWSDAARNKCKIGLTQRLQKGFWRARIFAEAYVQRCIDIVVALFMLILLSPLLATTAFLIRRESPGPIIFRQIRVGKCGKLFPMYKFRSMFNDAEAGKEALESDNESNDGIIFKIKNDPRVTRIGRVIRKLSIDELPQLFNVLQGSMSLVGPRPALPKEVDQYDSPQNYRLQCRPGITGTWQVSGRSDIPFTKQLEMDIEYMQRKSILTDITILLKTVPAVLLARGAY